MKALEDVFVDSSAWIALADKDDLHHREAAAVYPSILKNFRILVTSNLVIAETYVVLLNEMGHKEATEFLERIKSSPRIMKIYSIENVETYAERILAKYFDQNFSYTDAVSFSIMHQQKIKKAFSFDKHFVIPGFINLQ
jgi:predicted nucleic acid-binding protein